ncbi:MAG: dihydropyrimidinase [Fusobacteriaceae bacterium]
MSKLIFKNGKVLIGEKIERIDIRVSGEKIVELGNELIKEAGESEIDLKGCYVAPGGIDVHTHFNIDVGILSADDFSSGTKAALCGGTTTIIDHPGFGPKDCSLEYMIDKYMEYGKNSKVDYSFHGVFQEINENTFNQLKKLKSRGISSIKIYLTYTYKQKEEDIIKIFKMAKELDMVVAVHAENDNMINYLREDYIKKEKKDLIYHAYSRPGDVEADAVGRLIKLAYMTEFKGLYLVHISSKEAIDIIQLEKKNKREFYVETCPQYLYLDNRKYLQDDGVKYILSPPLREKKDIEALWKNIKLGNIDTLGTDHCSFLLTDKNKGKDDFTKCPNGIPGVEERNVIFFSEMLKGGITVKEYLDLVCENPAKIFGIWDRKGSIEVGKDADLVIFTEKEYILDEKNLKTKAEYSCFNGMELKSEVSMVLLRGEIGFSNGSINKNIKGKFLVR